MEKRVTFTSEQESIIKSFIADQGIPGVAVSVVKNGRIIAEGGFGKADLSTGMTPTEHTQWPVASITKSFTGVSAMQLVEQGILRLDVPLQDYLPSFSVSDPEATRLITTRLLLRHDSGMGRTGHQDRTREEAENPYPTRSALVGALHSTILQSAPGECFSYCNEGYAAVGHLIETLADISLEEYLTDRIFNPIGMTRSSVRFADWKYGNNSTRIYGSGDAGPFDTGERHGAYSVIKLNEDYSTFLSSGGIISTAHDLARYQIASMDYASSALGLTAGSLDHMQSVQFPFGDTGWGYGFGYWVFWSGETRVIGHAGGLPGVSNYSMMIPAEKTGVVVLTNRSERPAALLAEQLLNTVRGRVWRASTGDPMPFKTRYPKRGEAALAEYKGRYAFRNGIAEVYAGDGGVVIETPSRLEGRPTTITGTQVGPDSFMTRELGMSIPFVRDEEGKVVRFLNGGYSYNRV
jgi:CubicO group peptidase (beta-lactamase class C family)